MQYSFVAVGALLLATAAAQPHGHQHKHARNAKRDVKVVTDYVDVTETVIQTATVWVDEKGHTISPAVTGAAKETRIGKPHTVKAGIFNEPASSQAPVATPTPTPTPDTTTAPVEPASTEAPAPVVPVSVPEPVTPSSPAVVTPPAVIETQTPVPSNPSGGGSSGGGSPSGDCSPGSPCSGDITFYEAGLGACGVTNDGDSEPVVALAHEYMGTQSNGNPFCGKSVTIDYNGVKVIATVQDKCMGCVGRDLDLSNSAFDALGIPRDVGRTTASWWFN